MHIKNIPIEVLDYLEQNKFIDIYGYKVWASVYSG